jgi:glycosyltransferase involved in cell wall biosynthesis
LDRQVPLVTIGMPTYNGARYLAESLDSLLSQDYPNWELVISDNCSTDETGTIALSYAAHDPRIRYVKSPVNRGAAANFNRVLELATGPYFVFAADHDLWAPTFLSQCVARLEASPMSVLAHSQTTLVAADGRPIELMADRIELGHASTIIRYKTLIWNLHACNMVYGVGRLESFRKAGGFADLFGPDLLLLARMVLQGTVERVEEPLFMRRQNRPEETFDQERDRILHDLNPAAATDRRKLTYTQQMKVLRDAHLRAVLGARTLSATQRVEAAIATLACYRQRFGVPSTAIKLVSRAARVFPIRSWMTRPSGEA